MVEKPTQSRERGQGGTSSLFVCPLRSPEAAPLVGLGATPNRCTVKPIMLNALNPAALVAGSEAFLRSNFARPQTRPPSRFPHNLHIVAPDGRDRPASGTIRFSVLVFFVAGISPLRRRPEGFAVALWTASPTLPCFLIFIVAEGIAPAGATKGLSDRPLETFGAATFGVVCGLVLVVAKRFLVCVCKSGAQILPHSKSRRVLPAAAIVIHKDSTLSPLIPHPCPRMLPAPSLPPPSRRHGGRSTS